MAKIGIFGFYKYGNFGDDLMAILFGQYLKSTDHKPLIYGLHKSYSEEFGLSTTNSLEELIDFADCAVIGGGGILVPFRNQSKFPFLVFREELGRFIDLCEAKEIEVAAISIGGSGLGSEMPMHYGIAKMILSNQLTLVTLRNVSDSPVFQRCNKPYENLPDIVLSTSKILPLKPLPSGSSRAIKVGVNLWKSRRADRWFARSIAMLEHLGYDVETYYFQTHPSWSTLKSEIQGSNSTRNIIPDSMYDYLEQISKMDIVFTCKLHIGVAALSYGVPAYAWGTSSKARLFYEGANLEQHIIKSSRQNLLIILRDLSKGKKLAKLNAQNSCELISDKITESLANFTKLNEWVSW
jgi:hypothetical protein